MERALVLPSDVAGERRAAVEFLLARALRHRGAARGRARELARAGLTRYGALPYATADESCAEIERWLAERSGPGRPHPRTSSRARRRAWLVARSGSG